MFFFDTFYNLLKASLCEKQSEFFFILNYLKEKSLVLNTKKFKYLSSLGIEI